MDIAKDFDDFIRKMNSGLYSEQLDKLMKNMTMRINRAESQNEMMAIQAEGFGERDYYVLRAYHEWLHDLPPS